MNPTLRGFNPKWGAEGLLSYFRQMSKYSVQFVYLIFKLQLRVNQDNERRKIYLPNPSSPSARWATVIVIKSPQRGQLGWIKKKYFHHMAAERIKVDTKGWRIILCRHYGDSWKLEGYLDGIEQFHHKVKNFQKLRSYPNSSICPLVRWSDISEMRCFPNAGMKNKHDAIMESFGTMEEIKTSLDRLPSTTYSLLSSSLFHS